MLTDVPMRQITLVIWIVLLSLSLSIGQSCCSGGVPLSNNLGMPAGKQGLIQLTLSYDYNNLNTLKAGWEQLDDDSRERLTHSFLLNWGVNLSKKLSVEGILSFIQQERRITQLVGSDIARTRGLGDAVFLVNYSLFSSQDQSKNLRLALGFKAPLGDFNQRSPLGPVYNAELQPGSGSWDGILWTQWASAFSFRPSLTYHVTLAYSTKGRNDAYLGDQLYQFGNEIQLSSGLADRIFLGKKILDPALSLRYRNASVDRFNEAVLPATGGQWIFLEPSIAWWLNPNFSVNLKSSSPVMAFVEDTQFSPTFRFTLGIFYRFSAWNKTPIQRINPNVP